MPIPLPVPDIASLDLLRSVARLGSIRQAASVHGVSQPAASMRLSSLEKLLGVTLLDRSGGGAKLTPAGLAVVEWSERILSDTAELLAGAKALRSHGETHLRLAASMTVAEYLVPQWLSRLRAKGSERVIALDMGNSEHVFQAMRLHEADIGFVEGSAVPPEFNQMKVYEDDLVLVVSPGHPWSHRKKVVTPRELASTPLVLREPGSGTREILEVTLAKLDLFLTPLVELASNTAIKATVASGAGPGVLSRLAVTSELDEGKLVRVRLAGIHLERSVRGVWPKDTVLSPAAKEILSVTSD